MLLFKDNVAGSGAEGVAVGREAGVLRPGGAQEAEDFRDGFVGDAAVAAAGVRRGFIWVCQSQGPTMARVAPMPITTKAAG